MATTTTPMTRRIKCSHPIGVKVVSNLHARQNLLHRTHRHHASPGWSATSLKDPPHPPHRLHASGQLAGPDVKARTLPKHSPPNLPTYCTPEWPATRQGTCCTQPSTDESQTQSYELIQLNHLPMSRRCSYTTHTTQPSTDESQEHPHHQERGRAYKEGLPPS